MKLISGSISTCLPVVIRLNCDRSNLCFRSAMLDLERKCGELTGSIALQNARKAIDIRRQLPSTSDLGALAELLAGLFSSPFLSFSALQRAAILPNR